MFAGWLVHFLTKRKNTIDFNSCIMYRSQDMEFGRDHCQGVFRNPICNASLAFADGQEAKLVTSQNGRSVNNHLLFLLVKKVIHSKFPGLGKVISMATFSVNLSCCYTAGSAALFCIITCVASCRNVAESWTPDYFMQHVADTCNIGGNIHYSLLICHATMLQDKLKQNVAPVSSLSAADAV